MTVGAFAPTRLFPSFQTADDNASPFRAGDELRRFDNADRPAVASNPEGQVRFARARAKHAPMKARIHITLKDGVLDPQGKAVAHALHGLGFASVSGVRQGKYLELELSETDPGRARAAVADMCERLLANTVIENYEIDLDP